jgi:hypothetical protein
MKNKTLAIILFSILFLACGWTYTFDISTPASSDDPREAPTRFQEIKKSIQEREDVDHYWPLTGNEVSDACSGEHRKLTLQGINAVELAALTSAKSYVYRYGRELYYKDANGVGDGNTVQITKKGWLNLDDSILSNATWLTAKSTKTGDTVNLIKAGKNEAADTNVAILPDAARLDSNTAPTESSQIVNKKYVDDQITNAKALMAFGSYTTQDDENQTLLKAHAYLANQDGFVVAVVGLSSQYKYIKGYVGTTTDPEGAGNIMGAVEAPLSPSGGYDASLTFPVASGKYFEITCDSTNAPIIYWHPIGTLIKPTDNN